jgi:cell division protein ZapA (FtsZ GTPase activity inhibitor)
MGAYELSTSYSLVKIKMYKNPMNAESRNLIYKTMCMNENKTDNVFEDKAVVQAILICQAATQKNNFFNKIPFTVLDKILTFALQNIKRSQKSITNMHLLVYNNIYTSFFEKKFQWNTKLKNDNGVYRIFRPHLNSIKNLVKASKNENEPKISCKLM